MPENRVPRKGEAERMITYQRALREIARQTPRLSAKKLPLRQCLNKTLAADIFSPLDFPHFDNSAVDGYALCFDKSGTVKDTAFKTAGEIPAGQFYSGTLRPGQAMRIFTGAPVPKGAAAVVMQEHAVVNKNALALRKEPRADENIRFQGEDFRKGALLVKRGICLEPAHLAVAAAAGHQKAAVYPFPRAAILTTGNELARAGEKISRGKIYDSNTELLSALVFQAGGIPVVLGLAADSLANIRNALRRGLCQDILIISGGVSVGKYDFVKEALEAEGVREIFWKVNIKPGKPLYFGKKGKTLVFGLPGNPVSAFITFEEFVKPALAKMSGKPARARWLEGVLSKEFHNGPRPHFVRVRCARRKNAMMITPLPGQGSHQIGSLAKANGLWMVKPDEKFQAGQKIRVKIIAGDL